MFHTQRHKEKIQMRKRIKVHEERNIKSPISKTSASPLPAYLLERSDIGVSKLLSSSIKQKRKEKAARFTVPLPSVRGVSEEEMFKVIKTGKNKHKAWKRLITKPTFVGSNFTRRPVKYERFMRPMALRYKKAHVTHRELELTVHIPIIGVKKNVQSPLYTQFGILTRGSIIEVDVSELGIVTPSGKIGWGRYAQITNNPETDGCVNALLLI